MTHMSGRNGETVVLTLTGPIETWYTELLQANKQALYFRNLLAQRIAHLGTKVRTSEFVIDNALEFNRLNYNLWKAEVERLTCLIQSFSVAHQFGAVGKLHE